MESSSTDSGSQAGSSFPASYMLDDLPVAVCVLNDQAVIQEANREFSIISGISPVELPGVSFLSLVGESCHDKILTGISEGNISDSDDLNLFIQFRFGSDSLSLGRMKIRRLKPISLQELYMYTCKKRQG